MLTQEQVYEALKPITDPEINLSIVDLGLVYGIEIKEDGKVIEIEMTLTSPMCPFGPQLLQAATAAASGLEGVERVDIKLVWVPRWDPREHASEEARAYLGLW
jgi:metal-sulfur cluster biosynthetic enzyme